MVHFAELQFFILMCSNWFPLFVLSPSLSVCKSLLVDIPCHLLQIIIWFCFAWYQIFNLSGIPHCVWCEVGLQCHPFIPEVLALHVHPKGSAGPAHWSISRCSAPCPGFLCPHADPTTSALSQSSTSLVPYPYTSLSEVPCPFLVFCSYQLQS